jgi:hypothetical protein
LMRDMVFARRADSLLVRIATPAGPEPQLAMDLDMVAGLASEMYAALAGDITR